MENAEELTSETFGRLWSRVIRGWKSLKKHHLSTELGLGFNRHLVYNMDQKEYVVSYTYNFTAYK